MAQTFKAWIGTDLDEQGLAWAILMRERAPGIAELGAFLVDAWCLGVKDAFFDSMPSDACQAMIDEQLPEDMRETADPACVRALVEGAVAYAQSLGFLPHRDYRKARKVFGSIDPARCARTFTFGREGRPCFVVGPDDDEARIKRVLAVLTSRVGPEGFDFVEAPDGDDFDTDEDEIIDELYRFIEAGGCPDKEFTPSEAYGFVSGLAILPGEVDEAVWVSAFWGSSASVPVMADAGQAEAIAEGIETLREEVESDLTNGCFDVYWPDPDAPDREAAARRCCAGVQRALALDAKLLAWLHGHPDGKAPLAVLASYACGEEPVTESSEDEVAAAVQALFDLAGELPGPTGGTSSGR